MEFHCIACGNRKPKIGRCPKCQRTKREAQSHYRKVMKSSYAIRADTTAQPKLSKAGRERLKASLFDQIAEILFPDGDLYHEWSGADDLEAIGDLIRPHV